MIPLSRGRGVPSGATGRLPHALQLVRRRGADRGDGAHRASSSATSTWCSPITRPASPSPTACRRERLLQQLDVRRRAQRASWRRSGSSPASRSTSSRTARSTCDDDLLARLDVVVASVHSKLRMERQPMTERMVLAVASPHVDILGHCTGRKVVGKGRPESTFDAEIVFVACTQFDTARRDQLPSRTPRSAAARCSSSRSNSAADSRSTATPTPPDSSTGSPTGATGPLSARCRSSRSSTRWKPTTCSNGRAPTAECSTPPPDEPICRVWP